MLRNYLRIAFRNLKRYKLYSFINIAGLAVGIAVCLVVALYIHYELSFDKFYPKADHIYRVVQHLRYPKGEATIPYVPAPFSTTIKADYPVVEQAVRVNDLTDNHIISLGDHSFIEKNYIYADPGFFQLFSSDAYTGKPNSLLADPNSVVVTKSAAKKYFHHQNPVGLTLKIDGQLKHVTGVVDDPPPNSSIQYQIVESLVGTEPYESKNWGRNNFVTYLLLSPDAKIASLEKTFSKIVRTNKDDAHSPGYDHTIYLQPLADVHLGLGIPGEKGSTSQLYLSAVLALFILLIACINFVNLLTSRSIDRMREIGLRKVMGAFQKQLIMQFLGESVLTAFLAGLVAVVLAGLLLPIANKMTGASIDFSTFFTGSWTLFFLVFIFIVGVGAGGYPAFMLSRHTPQAVMSGNRSTRTGGKQKSRQALVVFQFTISCVLIAATFVVYHQLQYMRDKDLGFNKEDVVLIPNAGMVRGSTREALIQTFKEQPGVQDASMTYSVPGQFFITSMFTPVSSSEKIERQINYSYVDDSYIKTLGVKVIKGRDFDPSFNDSLSVILNQSAATILFGPKNPVGEDIRFAFSGGRKFRVVGVVKDFNFGKLEYKIRPLVLLNLKQNPRRAHVFAVHIHSRDKTATIGKLHDSWNKIVSDVPFTYSFLKNDLDNQYSDQDQLARFFAILAGLAILMACMGLFALAVFSTEKRTKEIGIRKVLGASVAGIVALLSKDFLKLVGIGFLIAVPIAWYAMHRWLENFAYHIDIGIGTFVLVGALAMVIALVTVSWQSIRAAITNPVKSLHTE